MSIESVATDNKTLEQRSTLKYPVIIQWPVIISCISKKLRVNKLNEDKGGR